MTTAIVVLSIIFAVVAILAVHYALKTWDNTTGGNDHA